MLNIDEFFEKAWDSITKQVRHRLDQDEENAKQGWGFENQQGLLENWLYKYGILCYLLGRARYYGQIVDSLDIYGGILPRYRYYGPKDMKKEDPTNGWDRTIDADGKNCQIRYDMGVGQAPCILGLHLMGEYVSKAEILANGLASRIAKRKFTMQYKDSVVPQGKYLTMVPPFSNNLLEALCIAKIAQIPIPGAHWWRVVFSVDHCMWYDDKLQRTIILWFLSNIDPDHYHGKFGDWINKHKEDLNTYKAIAEAETDIKGSKYFARHLNYLIYKELVK